MTKDEVFRAWAPQGCEWTRWTKPVLFAHVRGRTSISDVAAEPHGLALSLSQVVPLDPLAAPYRSGHSTNTALVVDLQGAMAVHAGVAVARLGFRPVPLFNAYPTSPAAVDLWPIVDALEESATSVGAIALRKDAPPAFLLDAGRRAPGFVPSGVFDNRSVCTSFDFPTGGELTAHGIEHVVVLREALGAPIARDLSVVLARLQDHGLKIHEATTSDSREPVPIRVSMPSVFARVREALFRWSLSGTDEGAFGRTHAS